MAHDPNAELKKLHRAIKDTKRLEIQLHDTCKDLEAMCSATRLRLQSTRLKMTRKRRARPEG